MEAVKTMIGMRAVAKRLGVAPRTIYRLMADPDERFPAPHRMGRNIVRFEAHDVERYIEGKREVTR
jgi:predicted DNA-binding transcriptional regulator AlpA